jgi:nucleotidyltransferase/DNA polymerase involved in DNA repair
MERLHAVTPLVEQLSIDEAFLDVTALLHANEASSPTPQAYVEQSTYAGRVLAEQVQQSIRDEEGTFLFAGSGQQQDGS